MRQTAKRKKTMTETMKGIFEGAAGVRSLIVIFVFLLQAIGLYYGIQAGVVKAQGTADSAENKADEILKVLATQNNRQIEVERKQAVMEYKLEQEEKDNEEQDRKLAHLIKVTERIASKLNVQTGD